MAKEIHAQYNAVLFTIRPLALGVPFGSASLFRVPKQFEKFYQVIRGLDIGGSEIIS
jgi:hypothetical protein